MKTLINAIVLVLMFNNISAQNQSRLNITIFFDGILINTNGQFEFQMANETKVIPFSYVIGDLFLSPENYNILKEISVEDSLYIVLHHKSYKGIETTLKGNILNPHQLFEPYCIVRFTTINRRKQQYYFGLSSPGFSKAFLKRKEYFMLETY